MKSLQRFFLAILACSSLVAVADPHPVARTRAEIVGIDGLATLGKSLSEAHRTKFPLKFTFKARGTRTVTAVVTGVTESKTTAYALTPEGRKAIESTYFDIDGYVLDRKPHACSSKSKGRCKLPLVGAMFDKKGKPRLWFAYSQPRLGRDETSIDVSLESDFSPTGKGVKAQLKRAVLSESTDHDHETNAYRDSATPPVKGELPARFRIARDTQVGISKVYRRIKQGYVVSYELYREWGSNTQESINRVRQLVALAKLPYERQLDMTLEATTILVNTYEDGFNAYSGASSQSAAATFGSRIYAGTYPLAGSTNQQVLLMNSWTDNSIGWAWIGTLCKVYSGTIYSTAVIRMHPNQISNPMYSTVSHETGHNLNANHDAQLGKIMGTSSGAGDGTFSTTSEGVIESYRDTYGSCFDSVEIEETPIPTSTATSTPTTLPPTATPTSTPTVTPTAGSGGGSSQSSGTAVFRETDLTTKGAWNGKYGADGYWIANVATALPSYAEVSVDSANTFSWNGSMGEASSVLQRPFSSEQSLTCWYSSSSFSYTIRIKDGATHRVSLYAVDPDWDRAQTITVTGLDGAVLSAPQSVSSFRQGRYLTWDVSGTVKFTVTANRSPNAVVSGLFFGTPNSVAPDGAAVFQGSDLTTKGSWNGKYGVDGYALAQVATSLPSYAEMTVDNAELYTWPGLTGDAASALQRPGSASQVVSAWYSSSSFSFNVRIKDGGTHRMGLYFNDPDWQRNQTVVISSLSGQVLSGPTNISSFREGRYLFWNVSGTVKVTLTSNTFPNAVVSGVFFDTPGSGAPVSDSATFVGTDLTTKGDWNGRYGSRGHLIADVSTVLPSHATVNVQSGSLFTWGSIMGEAASALQRPNSTARTLSCWYSPASFTYSIRMLDSAAHRVSLYMVDPDWDRDQTIVVKGSSGQILSDPIDVRSFRQGRYLSWDIKGSVTITVTSNRAPNAVVSGVFFD